MTLTGKIWGRDYRKVVAIDPDLARGMPGLAIGLKEIEAQLSDDEVREAAFTARAVSRVTSYLSAHPRAAASTVGQLRGASGGFGYSTDGCSMGGITGDSICGVVGSGTRPDHQAVLRQLLGPGVAGCARSHGLENPIGWVTLETTGDEIVDVETVAELPAFAACVTEVVWAARLTGAFTENRSYRFDLRR